MLAAISIAYDLGFSHEDIEEVMEEKAQMWQGLQAKEDNANFPIPYEIHVTVEKDSEKSTEDSRALAFSCSFYYICVWKKLNYQVF